MIQSASQRQHKAENYLTEEELKEIYKWVDEYELSRTKSNISRDFADAVLLAEIIHMNFPGLVELHNYYATNSKQKRVYNWNFLQSRRE